jgi:hypothetical protein
LSDALPKRRRRIWLFTLLGVVLAAATLWGFLRGDHYVRTTTREVLESQLGALLSGQLHIDRIAELSPGHVVAEGIVMLDPQGRVVLRAKTLRLDIDLSSLPGGIRFSHGRLYDARIHAHPSELAGISLFEAFLPRSTPDETPSAGDPFKVLFDDILIDRAELVGDLPGVPGVHVLDIRVGASIHVTDELAVRVTSARGRMTAPYAAPLVLEEARTNIDTGPFRIVTQARVTRGSEQVTVNLRYTLNDYTDQLKLQLALEPVSPEWVREIGLTLPETLYGELRGTVRLEGPTKFLRFAVQAESQGGSIAISGDLPVGGTTRVHVESPRLSLPEIMAYAPPLDLSFAVEVRAPPDGPIEISGEAPDLSVLGFATTDAQIGGRYTDGRFTIDHGSLRYAGGLFDVKGWVDENADFTLDVRSSLPDTRREQTLRQAGFAAAIRSRLRIMRAGDRFEVGGDVTLSKVSYEDLSADLLVVEGKFEVPDGDFSKPIVRTQGRARGARLSNVLGGDLTFAVNGKNGRYVGDIGAYDPRGRTLTAHAIVTEVGRGFRIQADPFQLSVPGHEPWRAQADVVIHDEGVELHKVILASGPQRLEMSGSYSYSQAYQVDATLQSFDVGGLRELLGLDVADLEGTADGELKLSGVPGHPRIDAQGSLRGGRFLGMEDLDVLLSLVFVERRFDIESEIELPDGSRLAIYAGGEPGRGPTWGDQIAAGNYQFGLDFQQLPFEVARPWLAWLGIEPPQGRISAMIRGAGVLAAPSLELTSRIEGLAFGDWPASDVELSLTHDAATLELQKLRVFDAHGELVTVSGTVEAELSELFDVNALRASLDKRPFGLSLHVPARRLDELPAPLRVEQPMYASLELTVSQAAGGPSIEGSGRLGWPKDKPGLAACGLERHPEVSFMVRAQGNAAKLDASAMVDDELFAWFDSSASPDVNAWITGREAPHIVPTKVNARMTALATEELPFVCDYVAGPISAELQAEDIFAAPPVLRFALRSPGLSLVPHEDKQRLGNLRNARTVGRPFKISASGGLEQSRVAVVGTIEQSAGQSLELFLAIPRAAFRDEPGDPTGMEPVEARVRARRFDLAPIMLALPVDVRAGGRLDGEVRVAYQIPTDKLSLEGALDLSEGKLAITALGQELSEVSASLRMQGNKLRIAELSARDFSGKLSAQGELVYESKERLGGFLRFGLLEFPLRREGVSVSKLSGDVVLRGEITPARSRAELNLSGIRVDLPMDLATDLQTLDPHPDIVVEGEEPPKPPEDPHVIEILVRANPPFRMRRTDLTADVSTDLTVRYAEPKLTLQGSADLKRGSFELYGKRFELREGHLSFGGQEKMDPWVSLNAFHKIGSDEIGVLVEGRLSNPKVTFTHTNPAITDTGEIIAQLLGARQDTAQSDQDATGAAANFLAGATAGLITQEVKSKFGGALPVLSFETGNQHFQNARIRAGVQLDTFLEKRLGPLRHVVRGAYIEGFVSPGADTEGPQDQSAVPQSRGGGLLELRFPRDFVGSVEFRPANNWRLDVAWEP